MMRLYFRPARLTLPLRPKRPFLAREPLRRPPETLPFLPGSGTQPPLPIPADHPDPRDFSLGRHRPAPVPPPGAPTAS
jgi:hypothetical protein